MRQSAPPDYQTWVQEETAAFRNRLAAAPISFDVVAANPMPCENAPAWREFGPEIGDYRHD